MAKSFANRFSAWATWCALKKARDPPSIKTIWNALKILHETLEWKDDVITISTWLLWILSLGFLRILLTFFEVLISAYLNLFFWPPSRWNLYKCFPAALNIFHLYHNSNSVTPLNSYLIISVFIIHFGNFWIYLIITNIWFKVKIRKKIFIL